MVQTKGLEAALWFSKHSMMAAFKIGDACEGTASGEISGDLGEEALNHVEPGSRGRREVQMEAFMGL